jgi:ferrous iron transport protein A
MSPLARCRKKHKHGGRHGHRFRKTHLGELRAGETAVITSFHGGKGFREKMSGMGIFPGIEVEVMQKDGEEGMMLICVGGTRLMICSSIAGRIHVEEAG